jgi:TonB family protein
LLLSLPLLFLMCNSVIWAGEPVQSEKLSKSAIKLVKKIAPIYPEEARKEKISGIVLLDVTINEEGKVSAVKTKESAHPSLEKAAIDAVKQWEYVPMQMNGKSVAVITTITINFAFAEDKEKTAPAK